MSVSTANSSRHAGAPDIEARLPRSARVIREGIHAGLHTGAQLYVSMAGEVVADAGLGEGSPGRRMARDMLLLWFSAGKPLTAVAVAQLVERGRLDWDDAVARFIPEFGQAGKEALTLRHLLTHTGGFRGADLALSEETGWDETVAQICAAPLEPRWVIGETAGYHAQSSWFVLGELVRRLDGRTIDRYVREEVCRPLGMHDTWLALEVGQWTAYGARIGVTWDTRGEAIWNSAEAAARLRPGAGVRGPIRELGRFYEWLLALRDGVGAVGAGLLRPETVRAMTVPVRVGRYDKTFRHVMDFGLGFIVDSNRYGAATVPYGYGPYCSVETFGHSGSQCACAFADPARQLVVAWVFNGRPGEEAHQARARALNAAIYEDLGLG
ncbi:MAG TPA: serine hydrolase domain-containing protein [Methylomirabilota bacterium]|nr:serine hydrolase domain-containing protein [Methylomirabilota bacterium]